MARQNNPTDHDLTRPDQHRDANLGAAPDGTGKDEAPAHSDTVLESLGKAIIAPVKNTADPDNDPTTR